MMKQFLSIVLRNQFNLFYRFGYTFMPKSQLVEFDGNINNKTQENIIKQFKTVTPFEYDVEYLILHLETVLNNESEFVQFEINNIVAVYPLSKQAKTSIESKIDQRIRLEKPIFETILPTIETEIENKEVEKAISALWTICKIEDPLEKYVANIRLENIFNGLEFRKHGTKANKIQNGNYWEYLIAYDRFDYFPNSTLGYFYDAGQVFAYSKGHSTFEGSGIHNFLENLNSVNPTVKLLDIINYLETEEQLKRYVSQTTTSDIKQYIVTPLYLMLRDEIRKSDDITQTKLFKNLDYLKKFDDSFNYAVILLGAFFGFRKFYDNYYEALNLRFYKDFKAPQKQTEKEEPQEKVDTILETDNSAETVTEGEQVNEEQINEEQVNEEQVNEEQALTTNEERLTETTSVEEQNLSVGEQQTEIKVEKQNNVSNTQQDNNKEVVSDDITSQYQKIIEQALNKKPEVKLTDIAEMIKAEFGNRVQNGIVENVARQISGIEIIKIGRAKGVKRATGTLFNEQ
jgi:hypothetical protein